jgi:excinuclease ABC subunit C
MLMRKGSKRRFSIEGKPLYPHIKLTRERFPRLLATRLIANDGAEYFGAFLNRTNARILIDLLNRVFRLRSCEIDIDGSFNYPCTMHYKQRCLAPCVADLKSEAEYAEMVGLVRLFLLNDRPLFASAVTTKIKGASAELDFEEAARWRDILTAVEEFWADSRHTVWLDGTSDTFSFRTTEHGLDIFLTSQKGRRVLGERTFSFPAASESDAPDAIGDVIEQFYQFHAPKEIRVAVDIARKAVLQDTLYERFGRRVLIVRLTEKNRKISTDLALYRSSAELDVRRMTSILTPKQLTSEIKELYGLTRTPLSVVAIDAAHISGTNVVAAAIVWKGGRTVGSMYRFFDGAGEPEALADFVRELFPSRDKLFLIDGGLAQLNAVVRALDPAKAAVIAVVKPPADHSAISHFLTGGGRRIEFDVSKDSHRLLHRLRDEAHEFANAVHRDIRDFAGFYTAAEIVPSITETERRLVVRSVGSAARITSLSEGQLGEILDPQRARLAAADIANFTAGRNAVVRPLVIPVRFQDEMGAAEDLRPIEATSRKPRRRLR